MSGNRSLACILLSIFVFALLSVDGATGLSTTGTPSGLTRRQSCNPAVISYLVRDESGRRLTEVELRTIGEQLPKSIGDAQVSIGEVSFAEDGETFYWPEATDWQKGNRIPALQFINNETCTMHFTEVTLIYHDLRMRLTFNIEIARTQPDRRPVIDALTFQEGAFELDLKDWPRKEDQMIPAQRWKKVKDKA